MEADTLGPKLFEAYGFSWYGTCQEYLTVKGHGTERLCTWEEYEDMLDELKSQNRVSNV